MTHSKDISVETEILIVIFQCLFIVFVRVILGMVGLTNLLDHNDKFTLDMNLILSSNERL